jgi:uncharacterized protein YoxC
MDKIEIWGDEPEKEDKPFRPVTTVPSAPAHSAPAHPVHHKPHHVDFESSKKGKPFMRYLYIGLVIIAIAFVFVIAFPAYKGYSVYKQLKTQGVDDTYVADMTGLQQAKNEGEQQISSLQEQLAGKEQQLAAAQQQQQEMQAVSSAEQERLQSIIDALTADIEAAMDQRRAMESTIEEQQAAIADSARKLCCVKRFDDPSIDSYEVDNDKIVCGASLGQELSC